MLTSSLSKNSYSNRLSFPDLIRESSVQRVLDYPVICLRRTDNDNPGVLGQPPYFYFEAVNKEANTAGSR
jgi:hypothetical protein